MSNRLLLIEDHYDVAEMLVMYFTSHGYDVLHADNGTDGIEIARTRFPNLILLDVMLPDMDGYDTCVQLRKQSLTKYIPIIFLTQRDERANKVKGLQLGADDYIIKPFDIDELRLRVQASIRRATRENLHEPRTGLPAGPLIHDELERRKGENFILIQFSVAGFQSYSDVYGFMAANDVLNFTAKIIQNAIVEKGTPNDFLGIDNDTFFVITYTRDTNALEQLIRDKFEAEIKAFYTFADAERGGILVGEGSGEERLVTFMTLETHKNAITG